MYNIHYVVSVSGDLFVLVFAIDNKESFQEVIQLREQIIDCKKQCHKVDGPKMLHVPMVIVANKCDRENHRVIDPSDVEALLAGIYHLAYIFIKLR